MRSRTGCKNCRQRKLKCDEQSPTCGNCRKGQRDCQPSDRLIFRHQQNASMNGVEEEEDDAGGKLGRYYGYKDTFHENHTWVDVPKNVTFVNVDDPYNMSSPPDTNTAPPAIPSPTIPRQIIEEEEVLDNYAALNDSSGLEALSSAATGHFDYIRSQALSSSSPENHASPSVSNNLNFILNPSGHEEPLASPSVDPPLSSPRDFSVAQFTGKDLCTVTDHEVSFLLRHFGEITGQWMDLFDLGCYFAHLVPVQALSNPLLKYSACAYAAKQLGRVNGRKATIGGIVDKQAEMEIYPQPGTVDWSYISAKYYDKAISLLMEELSHTGTQEVPLTPIVEDAVSTPQSNSQASPRSIPSRQENKKRRLSSRSRSSLATNADETLAAAAILCVYEFLDNANTEWARHLSGTKSLFDMAEYEGMMPVQSPSSPGAKSHRIKPSRARKAIFWNFARQDFLAAFINEGQTRLNTEDLGLWRAAGLHLDEKGFVIPSNTEDYDAPERQLGMREDMISNALIWLMSKIINYIASGDSIDHVFPQNPSTPNGLIGINHMVLLERWKELEKELEAWFQGLPETFKPCARLPPIKDGSVSPNSPRAVFSEIWYSIPMCASTMQSYYMARIILLMNKPHESTARRSTLASRLHSYRAIELEVRHHSHEICGIALGRPEGSVRIHQVQPLFISGQCLTEDRERRIILDLLRGIESNLGWATDYRVKQLLKEWSWEEGPT